MESGEVTPVHKQGSQADAKNYCPISVMGPLAKLYVCCLNLELETRATHHAWCAPTQAGFRWHYRLEDLVVPVDYLLARAQTRGMPLALCLVDLEKAFDTVPHQRLLEVVSTNYGIDAAMLENIRWVLGRRCYLAYTSTVWSNISKPTRPPQTQNR